MKQLWLCLAAVGLLLSGCAADDVSAGIAVSDLTGTWVLTMSDGTQTLILNSDMTYDKTIKLEGSFPIESEYHDTWSLSGSVISISYQDFGQVSDYLVTLADDTMTWDNGSSIQIWKRQT